MKHQVDFLELLQIDYEKYPVIAVVGGGGKTSLIYRLTDELIDKGKRVIITTTTHMAGESELPFARGGDAVRVKELLDKERYVIAAEYEEDTGKYASLTDEKLEEIASSSVCAFALRKTLSVSVNNKLEFIIHHLLFIPALFKSSCNLRASKTGVVSGKVTITTSVSFLFLNLLIS